MPHSRQLDITFFFEKTLFQKLMNHSKMVEIKHSLPSVLVQREVTQYSGDLPFGLSQFGNPTSLTGTKLKSLLTQITKSNSLTCHTPPPAVDQQIRATEITPEKCRNNYQQEVPDKHHLLLHWNSEIPELLQDLMYPWNEG